MTPEIDATLKEFLAAAPAAGGIMTDLDGTAVHEFEGRIVIPERVAVALKTLNDRGRPAIINSLRFPLNVINTFGREWYSVTNAPLPMVSLNGSLTGYLVEADDGNISFREADAFPRPGTEIAEALAQVAELVTAGADDMALFLYPSDWTKGEIIWTPTASRLEALKAKYLSASLVFTSSLAELEARLKSEPHCMLFVLIETIGDKLMAYQHVSQRRFITRAGVDKRFGAHALFDRLKLNPEASVGAGDTMMDNFLSGIGLAVTVGAGELGFAGAYGNVRVRGSPELGDLLFRLAELDQTMRAA
jgi:hypothetical protein